jgi:hypothetical protein
MPACVSGIFLVRSLIWTVGFDATLVMLLSALFWPREVLTRENRVWSSSPTRT